jgi:restriction endonuclease S subunit
MRDGWTDSTLGEIAHWQGGVTPSMSNNGFWENGTIPWISSGDVLQLNLRGAQKHVTEASLKETSLKLLPVGTIVVVVRSGILIHTLPIAILESSSTINQDIKAGVPHSNVLGQFLFWVLRSNSQVILESCRKTGTTVQSISTDAFLKFPVLLPPLDEQKRIVDVVSSVDAYIDALQQQADTARTARNAVLHELLSTGGNDWSETTLGGVAVFYNGKAYKQDELLASGKYRVLRVGNFFSNGNWYWSDLELDANKYCDNGDLLYAWSASFGPRIWTDEKVIYHYHIWKVEEKPLQVEKKFLYYWLEDDVQRMKRDAGTGSIMMHITKGEIEARAITLPPLGEQKRIVEIVSSMDEVVQSTERAVIDAKSLRSGLLSDLLSGEHEISMSYDKFLKAA